MRQLVSAGCRLNDHIWKGIEMSELHIVAVLYAKDGGQDALRADLVTVTKASAAEAGNLSYELFGDTNDERRFVLLERWRDQASRDRHHNESAHIARFHAHGADNIERREVFSFLKRLA
jgi:quinol monooxygenase YgiN